MSNKDDPQYILPVSGEYVLSNIVSKLTTVSDLLSEYIRVLPPSDPYKAWAEALNEAIKNAIKIGDMQ
jgi:hypothetical protein